MTRRTAILGTIAALLSTVLPLPRNCRRRLPKELRDAIAVIKKTGEATEVACLKAEIKWGTIAMENGHWRLNSNDIGKT